MRRLLMPLSAIATVTAALIVLSGCEPLPTVGERERTTPNLIAYDSCDAVGAAVRQNLTEYAAAEVRKQSLIQREDLWEVLPEEIVYGNYMYPGGSAQYGLHDHRPQPEGAADIVRVVGDRALVLDGAQLEVIDISDPASLDLVGSVMVEGWPLGMLVATERVVVLSSVEPWSMGRDHPMFEVANPENLYNEAGAASVDVPMQYIKVTVFDADLADASFTVADSFYLPGTYDGAYVHDDVVTVNVYRAPVLYDLALEPRVGGITGFIDDMTPWNGLEEQGETSAIAANARTISRLELEDVLPLYYATDGDAPAVVTRLEDTGCANVFAPEDGMGRGFNALLSVDLQEENLSPRLGAILGAEATLRGHEGALFVVEPAHEEWWYFDGEEYEPATNLHRFELASRALSYAASARVQGTLSPDRWHLEGELLRAVAVPGDSGLWWRDEKLPVSATVYTLRTDDLTPGGLPYSVHTEGEALSFATTAGITWLGTAGVEPLLAFDAAADAQATLAYDVLMRDVLALDAGPSARSRVLAVGPARVGSNVAYEEMRLGVLAWVENGAASVDLVDDMSWTFGPLADGWWQPHSQAQQIRPAVQQLGDFVTVPMGNWRFSSPGFDYLSEVKLLELDAAGNIVRSGVIAHSAFYASLSEMDLRLPTVVRVLERDGYLIAISDVVATSHQPFETMAVSTVSLPASKFVEPFFECWGECRDIPVDEPVSVPGR